MKLSTTIFTICLMAGGNNLLFSQNINEDKAKEVIEKAIQATGGKELLNSIKTLYSISETTMDGRKVNWITKEMVPNKGSFEIEYQGRIVYRSWFDGKIGYETVNGEKKLADPEEFKEKLNRKYIMNELAYLDPSLYKVELIENNPDKKYNEIKATSTDGKVLHLFYDAKSYLLKKETKENPDKNAFSTVIYNEYKKFGDLTYCSKTTFPTEDGEQIITLTDLYYNKKISEKDFK